MVGVAGTTVALGLAIALVVPSAANAADVVSQGNGRLITTSLFNTDLLDSVAALRGANAVNTDASGDVKSDTPLDASVLSGVAAIKAGPSDLFGDTGIIRLGAVGQYAQANDDGSSVAFSGTVTAAPSLVGSGTTVTGSNLGTPGGDSSAEIKVGTAQVLGGADLVDLDAQIGVLAASAQELTDQTQSGKYDLAGLNIGVGGTLLQAVTGTLRPAIETLITAAGVAGLTGLVDPINADGTVSISLDDLLAQAGVASVNDLPVDTNLLSYLPAALVTKLTAATNSILDAVQAKVTSLGVLGIVLDAALTLAQGVINPVLSGLADSLGGPLGTAIDAVLQLTVNHQVHGSDGSFTQTALVVGVGTAGSLASVNLANATVGPNAGIAAVPIANQSSLTLAGILVILALGAWFIAARVRRRTTAAA
jgi:hypothetical protein